MSITTWKLAGYAKWAMKLLMTEMFVPGGTLLVVALLLAERSSPAVGRKLRASVAFPWRGRRTAGGGDLLANTSPRRLR